MSALPPEADLCAAPTHFRFGLQADISPLFDHLVRTGEQR